MRYERFVNVNGFNYLSVKIINSIGNPKKSDAFDCDENHNGVLWYSSIDLSKA